MMGPGMGDGGVHGHLFSASETGSWQGAQLRYRRDAEEVMEDIKEAPEEIKEEFIELEHKAEEKLKPIAEMTHMKPW